MAGVKKVRDGLSTPAPNLLIAAQSQGPIASQGIAVIPPSGGPVVERTTSDGVTRTLTGVARFPSMRSTSSAIARRPISGRG